MGARSFKVGVVVLLAANSMLACSGGTEGPSTYGPGPSGTEPTSPLGGGSECLTCAAVLDALGTGEIDGEMCDETEDLLEDLGRCACDQCAVTCGPVCSGGEGQLDSSCWSCMSASCSSTIASCRAH